MASRLIGAAALTLLLASPVVASAQDLASQLVGVWKRTGVVHKVQATGETSKPDGENPSGMLILSRGGHFVWIFIADGRKPPASQPPTDAERVYLNKTGSAGGGTYKVNGDKVTLAYDQLYQPGFYWNGARSDRASVWQGADLDICTV